MYNNVRYASMINGFSSDIDDDAEEGFRSRS
jgi:hypothetical protein